MKKSFIKQQHLPVHSSTPLNVLRNTWLNLLQDLHQFLIHSLLSFLSLFTSHEIARLLHHAVRHILPMGLRTARRRSQQSSTPDFRTPSKEGLHKPEENRLEALYASRQRAVAESRVHHVEDNSLQGMRSRIDLFRESSDDEDFEQLGAWIAVSHVIRVVFLERFEN
jgi:hypothetical protein